MTWILHKHRLKLRNYRTFLSYLLSRYNVLCIIF
ncbi:MAG TPA: hypothetical protein DCW58_04305 [Candidatus Pacebacteria bacterium]|nr:hypothetical protein [Candidatus Paceibacterota bacterium]